MLTSIPSGAFIGLDSLTTLFVFFCYDDGLLDNLDLLWSSLLHSNQITSIESAAFVGLRRLVNLYVLFAYHDDLF